MTKSTWRCLGAVPPSGLTSARAQLHQAAQIVQSLGRSLLPPRADDSHSAMHYEPRLDALAGELVNGRHLALRPSDLTLLYVDRDLRPTSEFALDRRTHREAVDWLHAQLGGDAAVHKLDTPFEIAEHPIRTGEPYRLDGPRAHAELGTWFGNAAFVLQVVADREPGAGRVLCWPHHLDIATLIEVAPDDASESAHTVGVGLSPGDEAINEPYFYVTPWPHPPDVTALGQPTPPARWYTDTFVALVLEGSEVVGHDSVDDQRSVVTAYLDECVPIARAAVTLPQKTPDSG